MVGGQSPFADRVSSGAALDVVELTAERIQQDYVAGRYTAAQLTRAFLDRIARHEEVYNAFISMNPDALEIAAELDEEYRTSGPRGPLHGVPVVIKDNLYYGGLVTTAGYRGFSTASGGVDMIPENDAAVVERVRRAGAIVLGKTNMSDFARDGTRTRSSVAGVTRNAHDVTRAPGGSSGGTATAVNASFAVLGLGTETGGSIENPAASQGLVGVKPTFGLVPLEGVVPFDASHRDVVGPIARTVRDAAVTLDAIAGPAGEDPEGYASERRIPPGGYAAALDATTLRGRRFGLVGPGWRDQHLPLAPESEALYRRAIAVLEEGGAEVVEDPFRGTAWRELYATHGSVPSVDAGDLLRYMQELGAGAAFHSPEEWEALAGEALRTNGRRAGRGYASGASTICPANSTVPDSRSRMVSRKGRSAHTWRPDGPTEVTPTSTEVTAVASVPFSYTLRKVFCFTRLVWSSTSRAIAYRVPGNAFSQVSIIALNDRRGFRCDWRRCPGAPGARPQRDLVGWPGEDTVGRGGVGAWWRACAGVGWSSVLVR